MPNARLVEREEVKPPVREVGGERIADVAIEHRVHVFAAVEQERQIENAHGRDEVRYGAVGRHDDVDGAEQQALEHRLLAAELHRRVNFDPDASVGLLADDARHFHECEMIGLVDAGRVAGTEDDGTGRGIVVVAAAGGQRQQRGSEHGRPPRDPRSAGRCRQGHGRLPLRHHGLSVSAAIAANISGNAQRIASVRPIAASCRPALSQRVASTVTPSDRRTSSVE